MNFYEHLPVSLQLSNLVLIEERKSKKHKEIKLFNHPDLGKVFILDKEIQHIEAWVPIYHETLVHLPIAFINKIEKVLILGGGDFFAAKEVLKYKSIKEVIMLEHDKEVINLISQNYRHVEKIINDKRFKIKIEDAFKGLEYIKTKFDLIINDSVDLINYPSIKRYDIFKKLSNYLNPNGVCCDLIYRHIFEKNTTQKTIKRLKKDNLNFAFSLVCVPEYPGILHVLVVWGYNNKIRQNLNRTKNEIQKKWIKNTNNLPFEYFNPSYLNYYLYLVPYMKRIINGGFDI